MKKIDRKDIRPTKMATSPPDVVVNAGMRVINSDCYIYQYVGIGWVRLEKAQMGDYKEIPELI